MNDIQPGIGSSNPNQLTSDVGTTIYLSATIDAGVSELVRIIGDNVERYQKSYYDNNAGYAYSYSWFQSPNGITVHNNSLTFIAKENATTGAFSLLPQFISISSVKVEIEFIIGRLGLQCCLLL